MIVLKLQPPEFFRWFFLNRKKGDKNMKSKILITGAIFCAITTTSAHAVTKCVALNSSTTCTSIEDGDPYRNRADWESECTTNGVSVSIKGVGVCSANSASTFGDIAYQLTMSGTTSQNLNCWCKMTSPAVSRWTYYDAYSSASYCAQNCAFNCAYYVQRDASFRSGMFRSFSD